MPAVVPLGTVLVTSANGFIADWIVKHLLEHGFSVRGTVRSAEKADNIRSAITVGEDRLGFVIVGDVAVVCVIPLYRPGSRFDSFL